MWGPFPHLSMTNEGNICYKHGVCWCNVVLSKPHHCIKDKNHTLGPWLWSMQTDYWFEYQKAQVWQHKNLDLICTTGPHALHTAKGNIVSYEHVNIQRVPNQTRTLLQTPCAVYFKRPAAEQPHCGSKCPIFTSLSPPFSPLTTLNLPHSNLARVLLPSCVSR